MLSESWFAVSSHDPVGSIAKLRGVFPPVRSVSMCVNVPVCESIANTAMLSSPRFEAKRNLPEGSIPISAAVLLPLKPFASVETVYNSCRAPVAALYE